MNRLLQLLDGRRVAIVGNAPEHEDRSAEIESAEVVVRFNHFYNYDSGNVGKRVDILLQTFTSTWQDAATAGKAHVDVVRAQRPAIFVVKHPNYYLSSVHAMYGKALRIDNLARLFEPWWRFTTGTAALCYLAQSLVNAEVKVYGFAQKREADWDAYIAGDGHWYQSVAEEERAAQKAAIEKLESLKIVRPAEGSAPNAIPRAIVIPVKANSEGAPGKNRALLGLCIDKLKPLGYPIHVVGDDYDLLNKVQNDCITTALPAIDAYADVTESLRNWQVKTGFCGDVALVQCTSPRLKAEWVDECFNAMGQATIAATATELGFKPTAIYREENNVFVPASQALPAASVARQRLPKCVRITGAVEAFHTDALALESFWSAGVMEPVMIPAEDALDVDTAAQLEEVVG